MLKTLFTLLLVLGLCFTLFTVSAEATTYRYELKSAGDTVVTHEGSPPLPDRTALGSQTSWSGYFNFASCSNIATTGNEWKCQQNAMDQFISIQPGGAMPGLPGTYVITGEGHNGSLSVLVDSLTITDISVQYACVGFQVPLNQTISIPKKSNKTIPLKVQVYDNANFAAIVANPVVQVTFSSGSESGVDVTDELTSPGSAYSGNIMQMDGASHTFQFGLGTSGFSASGIYTVTIKTGNSLEYLLSPTCTGTFVRQ